MNYKDLLSRYKLGTITEEEKKLIEEEISRYQVIEEIMFHSEEDLLSRADLEDNPLKSEIYKTETKQIKRRINKKFINNIIITVLVIVTGYFAIFKGVSSFVSNQYYNPVEKISNSHWITYSYYDFQAYTSLNMPGYTSSGTLLSELLGFGKYNVMYSLKSYFNKNEDWYNIKIDKGRVISNIDGIFTTKNRFYLHDGFREIKYPYSSGSDDSTKDVSYPMRDYRTSLSIDTLGELNEHTYVSLSILFQDDINMGELYDLMRNTKENQLSFKWVGVRTHEEGTVWSERQSMHLIGFNPNHGDEGSTGEQPNKETYPNFSIDHHDFYKSPDYEEGNSTGLTEEDIRNNHITIYSEHFKSRVRYLTHREDFVNAFDYNIYKKDFYEEALEYTEEHGVMAYGVLVYGSAKNLLDALDKIEYRSLYINETMALNPDLYYE